MVSPLPDVRMHGFPQRHTVAQALAWLDAQLHPLAPETVPLRGAAGRVLASEIVSDVDVPGFDRATMDGYAVVAASTEGASAYQGIRLTIVGESFPGFRYAGSLAPGQALRIMTGAPMPAGADAVLPAERTDVESDAVIIALSTVAPEKHVGRRGEDIARGTLVLDRGRVLRPQDLGVASSIGLSGLPVHRRPRVRLVVTGNELVPSGSTPHPFSVIDSNGPMLASLVERDGGIVDFPGLVRDDADAILEAMRVDVDVVIVSGGSSVGLEDLAPMLVARHGHLAIHGIAMRPSSPTGLGTLGDRLVVLLPGNPVSNLCAYDFFAGRAIRALGARPLTWPYRAVRGRLGRKISSAIGRLDYARVTIEDGVVEPLAIAGASMLSSTTRADGFVIVGDDSEGFPAGAHVDVWLYD
jgi:molybdopterin molybdotransferase